MSRAMPARALTVARSAALAGLLGVLLAGACGPPAPGRRAPPSGALEESFDTLYRTYTARLHEQMISKAEKMRPAQIHAEAARLWNEVFAAHGDVVRARAEQVLRALPAAAPLAREEYLEIATGRSLLDPVSDPPKGVVLKQFLWNPAGAAQTALDTWLGRQLVAESWSTRQILVANAALSWEAVDRGPERPVLLQRQGPMVYVVDLRRDGDVYRVQRVTWLRPKSMGPILAPGVPPP